MAKRTRSFTPDQGDLFQQLGAAPPAAAARDLDVRAELLGAVGRALRLARHEGQSRERVADGMSRCLPDLPHGLTRRQLDAWTAHSREHHEFPARFLPAFCQAAGSIEPLQVLAHALGYELVDARDRAALALGEKLVAHGRLSREVASLKRQLGGGA